MLVIANSLRLKVKVKVKVKEKIRLICTNVYNIK